MTPDVSGLDDARSDLADRCRELAAQGLALAGAGNVSTRTGEHVLPKE